MKKSVFLISLLMLIFLLMLFSCNSPTGPTSDEPDQYWAKIEVIYDRDPAKIIFPQGNDKATGLRYRLFDPNYPRTGNYRSGGIKMEKIGDYKFRGYLENVFVQKEGWHGKHRVYVQDAKLYDGMSDVSTYTPYGITIEKAYEIEIVGYELLFKISRQ